MMKPSITSGIQTTFQRDRNLFIPAIKLIPSMEEVKIIVQQLDRPNSDSNYINLKYAHYLTKKK